MPNVISPIAARRHLRVTLAGFVALCLALIAAPAARGQAAADKKEPPPPPVEKELETRDGVVLKCTYYEGTKGKKTVPVIIVHGWEENRKYYLPLAAELQKSGHAVIVPDLRGHGESTARRVAGGQRIVAIDRKRMSLMDLQAMVLADLERVKQFLLSENNDGKLNIELLCVVGSEFGATLAANWAAYDWSKRSLPTFKVGQDVKALVFISPIGVFKGLRWDTGLRHPVVRRLSVMMIYGKRKSETVREIARMRSTLKSGRPPLPKDKAELAEKQDLFDIGLDTEIQGVKLLAAKSLRVDAMINEFIRLRLVNKSGLDALQWTDRTSPLD